MLTATEMNMVEPTLASRRCEPRVLALIDNLGPGGAQRQFLYLVGWLYRNGFAVEVVTYRPQDFFAGVLRELGISWLLLPKPSNLQLLWAFHCQLERSRPDVIISFLATPNLLAELIGGLGGVPVIASERSFDRNLRSWPVVRRACAHGVASWIVANSRRQSDQLKEQFPWLRRKMATISNCVDLERFSPKPEVLDKSEFCLIVVATFADYKNPQRLLRGFVQARSALKPLRLTVHWYGNRLTKDRGGQSDASTYDRLCQAIIDAGCLRDFKLHPPLSAVEEAYHSSGALCLPSLVEGCPNVVCEAMACARPVIASRISDIPWLLAAQPEAYLFDPMDTGDIARAIEAVVRTPASERAAIGAANRRQAEKYFNVDRFGRNFAGLIRSCTAKAAPVI